MCTCSRLRIVLMMSLVTLPCTSIRMAKAKEQAAAAKQLADYARQYE